MNRDEQDGILIRMTDVRMRIDKLVVEEPNMTEDRATLDVRLELERDLTSEFGLAIISDHFFDERHTRPFGSFESGTPTVRGYTIGDALFLLFQQAFYPDTYAFNEHPCLRSKSLARAWIADCDYDLAALIADFEKTRER